MPFLLIIKDKYSCVFVVSEETLQRFFVYVAYSTLWHAISHQILFLFASVTGCYTTPLVSGCCFCLSVLLTGGYPIPLVTRQFTAKATDWRGLFYSQAFLLCTLTCFYQGFPGSWQFYLEDSRASCCILKYNPSATVCLNHTTVYCSTRVFT